MKKLLFMICISLLMLSGCGNDKELKGIYDVSVDNKNNIKYQFMFENDGSVTIKSLENTSIQERGNYSITNDKNKNGEYVVRFKGFEWFTDISKSDGFFFDPDQMIFTEGMYSRKVSGEKINKDTPFIKDKDGVILYLKKK